MSKKQDTNKEPQKEKKVKVIYYDDGSTIVDMSGAHGKNRPERQKATFKERARTFFGVMRKMVLPMLCTLAAFTLIYIFLLAITGNL